MQLIIDLNSGNVFYSFVQSAEVLKAKINTHTHTHTHTHTPHKHTQRQTHTCKKNLHKNSSYAFISK